MSTAGDAVVGPVRFVEPWDEAKYAAFVEKRVNAIEGAMMVGEDGNEHSIIAPLEIQWYLRNHPGRRLEEFWPPKSGRYTDEQLRALDERYASKYAIEIDMAMESDDDAVVTYVPIDEPNKPIFTSTGRMIPRTVAPAPVPAPAPVAAPALPVDQGDPMEIEGEDLVISDTESFVVYDDDADDDDGNAQPQPQPIVVAIAQPIQLQPVVAAIAQPQPQQQPRPYVTKADHFYDDLARIQMQFCATPQAQRLAAPARKQSQFCSRVRTVLKFLFQSTLGYVRNQTRSSHYIGEISKLNTVQLVYAWIDDKVNNFNTVFAQELVYLIHQ